MKNILVADDDLDFTQMLGKYLTSEGYTVTTATLIKEARRLLNAQPFDLVLMDGNFPDGDGIQFIMEVRQDILVPIIVVTGRVDMIDAVIGLEFGADDFVRKPVDLRELLARIKAQLRRTEIYTQSKLEGADNADFVLGNCRMPKHPSDIYNAETGEGAGLTRRELMVARKLADNPGTIFSAGELARVILGSEEKRESIPVLVSRIRRKVFNTTGEANFIENIRGQGYCIFNDDR